MIYESDPRCKVIYIRPDFHVIFQSAKNAWDKMLENVSKTRIEKENDKYPQKSVQIEEITTEETESEIDSSDEEFKVRIQKYNRCKLICTHSEFQTIFARTNLPSSTKDKLAENIYKTRKKVVEKSIEVKSNK